MFVVFNKNWHIEHLDNCKSQILKYWFCNSSEDIDSAGGSEHPITKFILNYIQKQFPTETIPETW